MPATSFLTPTASAVQALSGPLQLGDLTLKNRNIMASLTRNRCVAPASVPNAAVREHYAQRAGGGAGLILSEGVLVSPQGTAWPYAPGIWNDEQVQGWKSVTDAVHEAGSFIFCQLWHLGRLSHPDMEQQKMAGKPVPGPSAIAARGGKFRQLPGEPGYITPTPLEDPRTIVEEFRHAAQMAKKAGFDGVELHSATGYIANQFLDTSANHRTDEWGGSVENRCRLGLEIVKALIEVWGPARVGIKVGPCGGYNDVGMPLPDTLHTYTHYITSLSALKIAYIQLVRYTPQFDLPIPPPGIDVSAGDTPAICRRGTPHDVLAVYAALIKPPPSVLADHSEAAYRGCAMPPATSPLNAQNPSPTRVLVNGGLVPAEAGVLIETGVVDAVVFGGLWMTNPDLQRRIERGVPLCLDMDMTTWYGPPPGVEDVSVGYNDWPAAT